MVNRHLFYFWQFLENNFPKTLYVIKNGMYVSAIIEVVSYYEDDFFFFAKYQVNTDVLTPAIMAAAEVWNMPAPL